MTNDKKAGGAMGGIEDELYREVILDHFKTPRNKGRLEHPSVSADGVNPLCGDQINITASVANGAIKDLRFEGHGCAISQASASMMTAVVKGKSVTEAVKLVHGFKTMFGVETPEPVKLDEEQLGDLAALEGVKKYPVRIKCAILSWNTLLDGLKQALSK